MMNSAEREAARLGMNALDVVLIALGEPPVMQNRDFREAEAMVGDMPNVVLEKPGVAPLRFVLGRELDVWVGPFSGVLTLEVSEETKPLIERQLEKVLRSSIECVRGKRSMTLNLRLSNGQPWLRLRVRAAGLHSSLEPLYGPYFRPGNV